MNGPQAGNLAVGKPFFRVCAQRLQCPDGGGFFSLLASAVIFDLDGTLVDSVYAHVLGWQQALVEVGVMVDGYRLHRHVGSSGSLIVRFAQRETGHDLSADQAATVHRRHEEIFRQIVPRPRPLPGAVEMFRALRAAKIPHAIATASYRPLLASSVASTQHGSTRQ